MSIRNYNGMKVSGSFVAAGFNIDIGQGRIAGVWFQNTKDNDAWTKENDGGGNATRTRNPNSGGRIALVFAANDPVNRQLQQAHDADLISEGVVGALTMRDNNGDDELFATETYIARSPDMSKAVNTRGEKTWLFDCGKIRENHGGADIVGGTG